MSHHYCKKKSKCSECCPLIVFPPSERKVNYAEFYFTLPTTLTSTTLNLSDPIQTRLHACLNGASSSGGNVSFTNWITDLIKDITLSSSDPTSILLKEAGVYRFHFQADVAFPGLVAPTGFILSLYLNGSLVQPSQYFDVLSRQFPGVDPFSNPTVSLGLEVPANSKVGLFLNTGTGVSITARTSIFDIIKVRDN